MQIGTQTAKTTPSFGSHIIVSATAFTKICPLSTTRPQNCGYIGAPWSIQQSVMAQSGLSDSASKCVMGIIKAQGAKKWFMFHLQPLISLSALPNFSKSHFTDTVSLKQIVTDTLNRVIGQFKQQHQDVTAFLVGGNKDSESSVFLYKKIGEILEENKVEYTGLLGQPTVNSYYGTPYFPSCDMYFKATEDTIVVKPPSVPTIVSFPPEELEKLKVPFDIVKTSSKDFLHIGA